MASLRRLPNSKYWIACYTDRDGRRRQASTKVEASGKDHRRRAQQVADGYEAMARAAKTSRQIQHIASALMREISGEAAPQYTARGWFAYWLDTHKAVTSPRSWERYQGQADVFLSFLGERADRSLAEIERADILRYRDERLGIVSVKTVRHELAFLRRALRSAVQDAVLVESPTEGISLPKQNAANTVRRRAFTAEELAAIMRAADDEWRSMVVFGLYTAQRLSDVASLTWRNIDTEANVVRLVTGKTAREMQIPIAAPLQRHIAGLPVPADPAAPIHPRAAAMIERQRSSSGLSASFRKVMVRAGLVEHRTHAKTGDGRGGKHALSPISFHSLRHSAVSAMKNAGVNDTVAMLTVGHESADVSRMYTHAQIESMRAAVNTLPDILSE